MPTGQQLVNKLLSYKNDGWGYLFGASGQIFTEAVYKEFRAKYEPGTEKYTNVQKAYDKWAGKHVADCTGIVYRAMKDFGMSVDRFYTDGIPWKGGKKDIKDVAIPNIPGIVLWHEGHMAILVNKFDDNPTIEARSTAHGVGRYPIKGRGFTHWGYLQGITYEDGGGSMTSFQPYRTVRYGDSGDDAKEMQLALNRENNAGLNGTGNFLENTEAAVRDFQRKKGLTVDGICGRNTWKALGFNPNY